MIFLTRNTGVQTSIDFDSLPHECSQSCFMMETHQRAIIVTTGSEKSRGLDELNIALGRGWRVVHISPMGGSGASRKEPRFAALVVIQRKENSTADVLQQVEEETDVVDGDGASADVADPLASEPPPEW